MMEALTKRELAALVECANYRVGYYSWRKASMRKLEAKGLVAKIPHAEGCSVDAWTLTADGAALVAQENEK